MEYLLTQFPNTTDFSNPEVVSHFPRIDLRKEYRRVTVQQVADYEQFIHDYMSVTDMESTGWLKDVLVNSIEANCHIQLKQILDLYPEQQQGGVLLFKLLADHQDADTFEHRELYQESIKSYRLSDTKDENVPISLAGFMALVEMLDPRDVPSDLVRHMLNGQKFCSVAEYVGFVESQLSQLDSPIFDEWANSQSGGELQLLNKYGSKLRQKHSTLLQKKQWIVPDTKASIFKAGSHRAPQAPPHSNQGVPKGMVAPRPDWQKWFLSQSCTHTDEHGNVCGGRHPTKYHDDPGILHRPFDPKSIRSAKNRSKFRFKSGKGADFNKRVYQLFEDCVEDDELLANMADMLELEHVHVAGDDTTTDEPSRSEDDGNIDSSPAMALAAMGLDQLLNYRAA